MNPRDEDKLRELLDDAVAGVEPRHGLGSIQSRTKVHPMSNRPWLLVVGTAVVATAATIAAFAVVGDDSGTTRTDPGPAAASTKDAPAKDESPSESTSESQAPSPAALPVYYVGQTGQGPRLYREFHQMPVPDLPGAAVAEAVREAVAARPQDPDYTSLWPAGADVQHVEMTGDTIVVDLKGAGLLHDAPSGMTKAEAQISVEQLIYTAQAGFQNRAPVRFLLDGQITDTLLGVPTSEPLANAAPNDVLALVSVTAPEEGATVSGTFTASGVANSNEANVPWQIKQGDKVVKSGFSTAEGWMDKLYPWTSEPIDVSGLAPGEYTFVAMTDDPSGGEGFGPQVDTRSITVR